MRIDSTIQASCMPKSDQVLVGAALDELCEELKAKLAGLEAATLRTSPVAREQARKAAASIASKMSGMMAAFN